ncbi:MAG: cytochrome P450 [Alphaproteobacteria bacterium]|nr:cytochrome P450 [Alphaproteobacteria bacterium]
MKIHHAAAGITADLTDPETWASPYAMFAALHQADGLATIQYPVIGKCWLLTGYDDVVQSLRDTNLFKNDPRNAGAKDPQDRWWTPKLMRAFNRTMIGADDLDHKRLRGLANKAFTPSRVRQLHEQIAAITHQLLDEIPLGEPVDLIEKLALPLPLRVIAELLGVEEDERSAFHSTLQGTLALSSPLTMLTRIPRFFRLHRFFEGLLERKRAEPQDDLISALVAAEEEGDKLTAEELMGTVFLLLFAGHETTVNLIGNGTLALLEHPEQWARLQADHSLVQPAIEEMLRFYSPAIQTAPRYIAEDCTLRGTEVKRGDRVIPLVSAANRDPQAFDDPDAFDIGRSPNKHLAFGGGPHFCIGAHLSRLEGRIAFQAVLDHFDTMALAVDRSAVKWRENTPGLRGLQTLPVVFH